MIAEHTFGSFFFGLGFQTLLLGILKKPLCVLCHEVLWHEPSHGVPLDSTTPATIWLGKTFDFFLLQFSSSTPQPLANCIVIVNSKISIIRANCSQRQPGTVSKETLKDTRCGTATPHCPQGEVEHVIAKEDWNQPKLTKGKKNNRTHHGTPSKFTLRDVDTKRQMNQKMTSFGVKLGQGQEGET